MPTQPAASLIASTIEALRKNAPFNLMDSATLHYIAARLSLRYYAKGEALLSPGDGAAKFLFIVQKGNVIGVGGSTGDAARPGNANVLTLSEGECFPVGALMAHRPGLLTYTAGKDTFCYQLPLADFEHALNMSPPFRDFAMRRIAALVDQSQLAIQNHYAARISDAQRLASPLKSIVVRAPVTVTPETTIREVMEKMKASRIGSVVIKDASGQPVGIFTERDVLDRVALTGIAQHVSIAQVMTPDPFTLPGHAPLFEAAQAMARFRFRHVLVMEEDQLIGVVSERDLFTLQRRSPGEIAKAIEQAEDVEALAHASSEVRKLAGALIAQGVGAEQLTQFVTTLNDAVTGRALVLAARVSAPPVLPWCWLGLGSEGRMEQTLATDQDNALIFLPRENENPDDARRTFLKFADAANRILDQCGFPLCKGGIMAGNPKWCLTPNEWRKTFADWLATPHPEALLNAAIFFDFRALHAATPADMEHASALRNWLNAEVSSKKMFFLLMAQNALQVRPPLGVLRDFVADDSDAPGTIDLKKVGARPFVDAARIFALRHGVSASNTAERIRLSAPKMNMHAEEAAAIVDAFHFVQLLRIRHQEDETAEVSDAVASHPNRINPDTLNELDRRILKEALRQARKLQSRLELDFQS